MVAPNDHWRLRARQFQRFYYHEPPLHNRELITAADLRKAYFHEPVYELSKCAPDEEAFPDTWDGDNTSLFRTVRHKCWKDVTAPPGEPEAAGTSMARASPTLEVQNAPAFAPDETEMRNTTAANDYSQSKTMRYLISVLDAPGPDGMPGGWGEEEEFPFTEKQVTRYLRWNKKQSKEHGKEESEEW
ncbi:hypothetical protein FGLOB1_14731 [Fusarium globosum]|uniref:Uncharacterized protein n=1 Tax=Fusarium globosum TaxID=78864 RepID=A0A8H5UED0_9HYPO|nr:hypothetical protein FGLOB1_14731 [Fusarium globosum]